MTNHITPIVIRYRFLVAGGASLIAIIIAISRYQSLTASADHGAEKALQAFATSTKSAEALLASLEPHAQSVEALGSSSSSWRNLLALAQVQGSEDPPDPDKILINSLLDEASAFLSHRIAMSDVGDYIEWRKASGYTLISIEDIRSGDIGEWYKTVLDHTVPEDASSESVLASIMDATLAEQQISQEPVLAGSDDGSILVSIHPSSVPAFPDYLRLEAGLGIDVWQGGMAYNYARWWSPPHSYYDILASDGAVRLGTLGITLKYHSGDWRSLLMYFLYDPDMNKWFLSHISQFNADPISKVTTWVY